VNLGHRKGASGWRQTFDLKSFRILSGSGSRAFDMWSVGVRKLFTKRCPDLYSFPTFVFCFCSPFYEIFTSDLMFLKRIGRYRLLRKGCECTREERRGCSDFIVSQRSSVSGIQAPADLSI
jgi:hypothetical protein